MKIATFNINGINGRLPILLRWLEESRPDVVCLQELKAPGDRFPIREIEKAGYFGCPETRVICKAATLRALSAE